MAIAIARQRRAVETEHVDCLDPLGGQADRCLAAKDDMFAWVPRPIWIKQ